LSEKYHFSPFSLRVSRHYFIINKGVDVILIH
jgi:hypothetical protein